MKIGSNSCKGEYAGFQARDSTISNDSCNGETACQRLNKVTIGNGSCNAKNVCIGGQFCFANSIVPDNACNDLGGVDTTWNGYFFLCNYCWVCSTKNKKKCRFGVRTVCCCYQFLLTLPTIICCCLTEH
jgi:hypothetical protein